MSRRGSYAVFANDGEVFSRHEKHGRARDALNKARETEERATGSRRFRMAYMNQEGLVQDDSGKWVTPKEFFKKKI